MKIYEWFEGIENLSREERIKILNVHYDLIRFYNIKSLFFPVCN